MSALTPSKLQIDGSAPFWSRSLTHSKCPSRQACINGDHPYRFKASRYSGYCKISSLALKRPKIYFPDNKLPIDNANDLNQTTVVRDIAICIATFFMKFPIQTAGLNKTIVL